MALLPDLTSNPLDDLSKANEKLEAQFAEGDHDTKPDAQQAKKLARRGVLDKEMLVLKADEARLEEEVNEMMFG